MSEPPAPGALGAHLEHCLADAASDWLKQWKAGRSAEYAWSRDIRSTHLTVQVNHGGRVYAQVTIIATDPWKTETTVFALQRHEKDKYHRLTSSLELDSR